MTRTKLILIVIVGLFIILQLVPLNQVNPRVIQDLAAPTGIKALLRSSCYDCHSNETTWPWYSRIAPGSFLITRDVIEGRKHLNFSEFGGLSAFDSSDVADAIIEMLDDEKMPILPYLMLHPDASLSASETRLLIDWAKSLYPE